MPYQCRYIDFNRTSLHAKGFFTTQATTGLFHSKIIGIACRYFPEISTPDKRRLFRHFSPVEVQCLFFWHIAILRILNDEQKASSVIYVSSSWQAPPSRHTSVEIRPVDTGETHFPLHRAAANTTHSCPIDHNCVQGNYHRYIIMSVLLSGHIR